MLWHELPGHLNIWWRLHALEVQRSHALACSTHSYSFCLWCMQQSCRSLLGVRMRCLIDFTVPDTRSGMHQVNSSTKTYYFLLPYPTVAASTAAAIASKSWLYSTCDSRSSIYILLLQYVHTPDHREYWRPYVYPSTYSETLQCALG